MNDENAQSVLTSLLEQARRAGADAADALLHHSVSSGVSWRLGKLEDVERSENRDLGLRILVGRRQASVSTTDISKLALKELVERCAAMAKTAPEDPYCGLAPAEQLAKPPFAELDLGDFDEPDTETLKARARVCEDAARSIKGVVNSEGSGASYSEGRRWFATTDGFFGARGGASHSVSVSVLAQNGAGMERDYDYDSKTHYADMRAPEAIGKRAGERAVERLGSRKLKSRKAPVIFDKRQSRSLISHLAGAINGASIARGVSFLKDKKEKRIFAEGINVIDDPFIRRGHGSRPFDGEGVAGTALKIIDNGVLTDWLMNSAHARQLGLKSNGRATRGTGGGPGAGSTNLYLEAGDASPPALMAESKEGLLVTEMFGPQVNANTGDYSVGCSGFWYENGAVAFPVNEITIASNLLHMYASLIPADDLEFTGATNAPSILVREMTIAGN